MSECIKKGGFAARPQKDLTLRAISKHLQGMRCELYDIGVLYRRTGKMILRTWKPSQLFSNLSELKRTNAAGADVFIRPAGPRNQGLLLIDDLGSSQLQALEKDGLRPAVVVETSPFNYQAWVRISLKPLAPVVATKAARLLANRYRGDLNSADWRHFGRLSGFTNRKPQHIDVNGMFPWVLLHSYYGKVSPCGLNLLEEAEQLVTPLEPKFPASGWNDSQYGACPCETFQKLFIHYGKEYGDQIDCSRIDWVVVRIMLKQGFLPESIAVGMREGSINIELRKSGHIDDYIVRTIKKALAYCE
jgi:hypothetical protein